MTAYLSVTQSANLTDSQTLMILFQNQIEEHQKLAEHYRELAAQREALAAELVSFQQQAGSDLSSLRLLVDKCKEVAPGAIASDFAPLL